MDISDLRQRLLRYIETADPRFLRLVETLAERFPGNEDIVAFNVEGKPLTVTSYNQAIQEAEMEVIHNQVISVEDLEKDAETW